MSETVNRSVTGHYAAERIAEEILAALDRAGVDTARLTPRQLATADQLHPLGPVATDFMAGLVALPPGALALDLGCGVGGPARMLAERFRCRVIGADLSAPYLRAAALLTERCGLQGRVAFCAADGVALPFAGSCFDLAWCQNVALNVPDKKALYAEIYRVLRPGAALALGETVAGANPAAPPYPLPWARTPEISFMVGADGMRALLEEAGFAVESWIDNSAEIVRAAALARAKPRAPGPTVAIAFGADIGRRAANLTRGLAEGTLANIVAVARRPA